MLSPSSSKEYIYIFELPATVIWELSSILDSGNMWEEVAAVMPDVCDIDIDACRRLKTGERPTEALLRIWGSMGYTIEDFYKILFKLKFMRCMKILLPFVDEKLHQYAHNIVASYPSTSKLIPSSESVTGKSNEQTKSSKESTIVYSKQTICAANNPSNLSHNVFNFEDNDFFSGLQNTPSVKYQDVLQATNNFAAENILGKGGYGVVYKGVWEHLEVAIKRILKQKNNNLEQQKERIRQSLQELRTLAKFRHDNVLSLYGYSMDGSEPCLIYQFMQNGSLEDRLFCKNGSRPIDWSLKISICKGVSCGLHFLHSVANNPILHGDVKPANILLDKHMEPKLGDFGLSRDGQAVVIKKICHEKCRRFEYIVLLQVEVDGDEKMPMIASHIKGTLAYLPPEFTTSKIISTKLDVYSFGIVLLEMATGQQAYSSYRSPPNLVDFTLKVCDDAKGNESLIVNELSDKRILLRFDQVSENVLIFNKLLKLGTTCTQKDRFARPAFTEIFASLT